MIAPRRPWVLEDPDSKVPLTIATIKNAENNRTAIIDKEVAEWVLRAVNAFDALLAVAKAGVEAHKPGREWLLSDALMNLDRAHPGWREWAP